MAYISDHLLKIATQVSLMAAQSQLLRNAVSQMYKYACKATTLEHILSQQFQSFEFYMLIYINCEEPGVKSQKTQALKFNFFSEFCANMLKNALNNIGNLVLYIITYYT